MFRSDKAGQLCLSLPEVLSNFAKDNRLTNIAQEIMVSDVLLKLLTFSYPFHFCIRKENAQKITGQLRTVPSFLWAHGLCIT